MTTETKLSDGITDAAAIARSTQEIAEKVHGEGIVSRALGLHAQAFEMLAPRVAALELSNASLREEVERLRAERCEDPDAHGPCDVNDLRAEVAMLRSELDAARSTTPPGAEGGET